MLRSEKIEFSIHALFIDFDDKKRKDLTKRNFQKLKVLKFSQAPLMHILQKPAVDFFSRGELSKIS